MNERPGSTAESKALLASVREHLVRAQELMDSIEPNSIFGARVQHLIDDLEEQPAHDPQPIWNNGVFN